MSAHPQPRTSYCSDELRLIAAQQRARALRKAAMALQHAESIEADREAEALLFCKLKAQAQDFGHLLSRLKSGGYVLSKWTHSRHYAEIEDVEKFLDRVGVKAI